MEDGGLGVVSADAVRRFDESVTKRTVPRAGHRRLRCGELPRLPGRSPSTPRGARWASSGNLVMSGILATMPALLTGPSPGIVRSRFNRARGSHVLWASTAFSGAVTSRRSWKVPGAM